MGVLFLFLILFLVLASLAKHLSPRVKGAIGEQMITNDIKKEIFRGLDGFVLNNLYLPRDDGNTTEIDVLFVCAKGLFVIESKNFAGYIFGDDQRKYWTVALYAGKNWLGQKKTQKHRFYNPVWQNRTHIKALWKITGEAFPTYSLIVFSDRGNLMNIRYHRDESLILQESQLCSFFTSVREQYPDVLSPGDMQALRDLLCPFTQVGEKIKKVHIDAIHSPKSVPQVCPLCGGTIVLRTAKRGKNVGKQFYGCSNYPKCHYTMDPEP